ncbi:excinuclease ABC subunit UvrC [Porphyromonadaceae bacterium W3.11]|nr:excinuclease ABC subunit UvrC [Porphyromonadaceae bacterium W3.11]
MIITKKEIKSSISFIPEQPGCYLYRDANETVIYVGKAKNLRRRLASYFQKNQTDRKTKALLRTFQTVEYMVVETELDALLLENNLIKQYQPVYNILLKEGNHYPYICITNEEYPKVMVTHKVIRDGSQYYGPYPNRSMAWTLIGLFKHIYKFRTCNLKLNEEAIQRGKFRVCLKYHINRCKGPCVGYQTKKEYNELVNQARMILNGDIKSAKKDLEERMARAAAELDFEKAMEIKQTIEAVQNYQAKSTIISDVIGDALVISSASDTEAFYINYLIIRDGNIISGRTLEFKKRIEEEEDEILATIIMKLLDEHHSINIKEVILAKQPEYAAFPEIKFTIPKRGDRKKVLELSQSNVSQYIEDKNKKAEKLNPEQRNTQILRELMTAVGLPKLPYHVETFDNSNIQGSNPVAACVVFKGAKPSRSDYRLYHIKGVSGPDDYASMHEVVTRRYKRMKEEGERLPDLIITDGGKGQMGIVRKALEELNLEIPIMGLAKDNKHNTSQVLYGNPPEVVGIMQRSQVFYLLERIQKEVHRVAINFHKKVRSKKQVHSELDEIKGIGPVNKKKLIKTFKSVKQIKEANLNELQEAIGNTKGKLIYDHFNKSNIEK